MLLTRSFERRSVGDASDQVVCYALAVLKNFLQKPEITIPMHKNPILLDLLNWRVWMRHQESPEGKLNNQRRRNNASGAKEQ